jgi:TonB-dependent Receptor Plug Domain
MGAESRRVRLGLGPHLRRNAWLALALWSAWAPPAAAQVGRDTVQAADSAALADSLQAATEAALSTDTIFHNLPALASGNPQGFATGVWIWDHDAIMASGANTVAELVADVPGVVALLGGDYGTPLAISAFGTGGGGVRVLLDGFEVYPLDGGVADLQRVPLVGISQVRLERSGNELEVDLTSFQYDDGRPFSLVEAGTGQFNTDVFRGTYADPTAFGGSVALGLERVDTRGYGADEGGNHTGTWVRYQLHHGDRAGLAVDYRHVGSETQVSDYAASGRRTDLTIRGRVEVVDGVVVEAYTGHSTLEVNDPRPEYAFEGGTRAQYGARVSVTRGPVWARGELRLFRDDELPSHRLDGSAGLTADRFGASGHVSRSAWQGTSVVSYGGTGWLSPLDGVTIFGSWDTGTYASRTGPVLDVLPTVTPPALGPPVPPVPSFDTTDRTFLRAGAVASVFGITVAGAALRTDVDQYLPLGLELDRGSPPAPGGVRRGFEAWTSLPTPWHSLRLEGSYQQWDAGAPYLPRQIYQGGFVFHRVYLESGNFELWWSLGVRGHDPMEVFVADLGQGTGGGLATVPFYQDWYGTIQARIVTVRLFFGWDNFTIRRNLQTYPGRLLPITRSFFGLKWDLWN